MKSIKLAFIMMLLVGCTYSSTSQNSVTDSDVGASADIKPEREKSLITKNATSLDTPTSIPSVECSFEPWSEYKEDRLLSHPTEPAYVFATSHKAVDADGAPNAYHPKNKGLDYLANAGYPNKSWWRSVLVEDPKILDAHTSNPMAHLKAILYLKHHCRIALKKKQIRRAM